MAIEKRFRKDGSYAFRVRVQDPTGAWYPSETFSTEHEAKEREVELEKKKFKGGHSIGSDARETTLDDYWDVWSIDRRDDTSDGWKISQDQMFRDHVSKLIGAVTMDKIKEPHIGRVLSAMKADGYADNTRKHVYSLLNQMFSDAVDYYKMLAESPVKSKFHRPNVVDVEREYWAPDMAWRFLTFIETMPMPRRTMLDLAPPTWLQLQAALRDSEVQALRWENVLFPQNEIRVSEIWNCKTGKLQPFPKGKRIDYVPMTRPLKDFLLSRFAKRTSEYVAPSHCGKMMSYDTYLRALSRACRVGGFPILTTQELRHTATEMWVDAGASGEDIRRLLNHADLSVTKRYIHRSGGRLQELAGTVGPRLQMIEGGAVSQSVSQMGNNGADCDSGRTSAK